MARASAQSGLAPWRVAIYDRAARLQAALDRIPWQQGSPDYQTVTDSISEALTASGFLVAASRGVRFRRWLSRWSPSGNETDRAWMAIHRGEEALVMIADHATLRAEALRIFPVAIKMGAGIPLAIAYLDVLSRLAAGLKLPAPSAVTTAPSPSDDGALAARGMTAVPS